MFDLRDDSLAALGMVAAIYSEFSVEVPIRSIFHNPTIREILE
jgi:acyl carrier protein